MPEIKMFVWQEGGITYCATEQDTETIEIQVLSSVSNGETEYLCKVLDKEPYSHGTWHTIELKDNVFRKDNIKAEQSLYVSDPDTGAIQYQQWRQRDAFASQVIQNWDFTNPYDSNKTLPVSEKGIEMLPDKVGSYLVNLIWVRYKGDPKSFQGVAG